MGRRAAKIAGRKEKQDAAKTKLYGKFGKMIVSAAKEGGVDVVANQSLAKLIRDAQIAKVPRDIIDRNLKRASESKQADFINVMYEGIDEITIVSVASRRKNLVISSYIVTDFNSFFMFI